jgi:predicted RNA-binding protein with PIN domain
VTSRFHRFSPAPFPFFKRNMSFLVDGNNVMAQRVGWHKDKALARRRLLEDLAHFVKKNGVTLRVVFDGAPDASFGEGSRFMGVDVSYARKGSNADERIKEFVESSRERQTLKVVTSDRALLEYVRRCGAKVIRSGEFRKLLEQHAIRELDQAKAEDTEVSEPEQGWMRYFGVAPDDDGAD